MAGIRVEDSKKWINAFIAIVGILVGFLAIRFIDQLGEWFDLEAKVKYFLAVKQVLGVILGLVTFGVLATNKKALGHLNEVYSELVKVVWPERDVVLKLTVGIIIGLTIISLLFLLVDFSFGKLLNLLY